MSPRPPHRAMPALCRVTPPDIEAFECHSCVAAHCDAHGVKNCYITVKTGYHDARGFCAVVLNFYLVNKHQF